VDPGPSLRRYAARCRKKRAQLSGSREDHSNFCRHCRAGARRLRREPAFFPDWHPFELEGVETGAHLTEAQAIQVAITEARAQGRKPDIHPPPEASFENGRWVVSFRAPPGPPAPAFGADFIVYVKDRNNLVSFSPGR
jgi:hypothetical protein